MSEDKLDFKPALGRSLLLLAVMLVFTLLGWRPVLSLANPLFSWLGMALLVGATLAAAARAADRRPVLTVSREGLILKGGKVVSWDSILAFRREERRGAECLLLQVKSSTKEIPISLAALDINSDELVALMQPYLMASRLHQPVLFNTQVPQR